MSRQSTISPTGRHRQRQRTRTVLLAAARSLLESGRQPSVTEAADAAGISRRTAYRYFPSQEKLLAESALEGLRPVMDQALAIPPKGTDESGLDVRIEALVGNMMKLAFENESLLRTMVHQTVLEKTPVGVPRRGTRRIDWIETALLPVRPQLTKEHYQRLVSALAVCTGMEAIMVLRDIRGLSPAKTTQVCQWMAQAVVRATFFAEPSEAKAR